MWRKNFPDGAVNIPIDELVSSQHKAQISAYLKNRRKDWN